MQVRVPVLVVICELSYVNVVEADKPPILKQPSHILDNLAAVACRYLCLQ